MCVAYGVAGAWGFFRGERRGLAGRRLEVRLAFGVRAGESAGRGGEGAGLAKSRLSAAAAEEEEEQGNVADL